jgi:hypothetical protein
VLIKPWMIQLLSPVVLLAIVALIAVGPVGQLVAIMLGFVLAVFVLGYARNHSRAFGNPDRPADDTHYWRFNNRS